ncbi:N-acetylmuramoyl-L-alanine amidase [Streptomyces sp. NPDC005483]|uniref:N-acetylmuramoyl-L-alanine amidase n=1 Tax=Streptomyces sp. NPDC005483 TaxID=3154882 RepID=UPI0033ADF21A
MEDQDHPSPRHLRRASARTRRAFIFGAGAVALGGVGIAAARGTDKISRTLPSTLRGPLLARKEGEVDQTGAEWIAASDANYRIAERPDDYMIDRVVIHVTQSTYPVALKVFEDPGHRAAAHYVVRARDGHVTQMVRELDVAYHAGNREWNERSIGIEHEGFVDAADRWFTHASYRASAQLCASICARYGIPVDREHIVGHHEVPGTDHTDPGPHWDWDRYLRLARAAI